LSDQTRELPEQPNLRFLKLEAKRRLAAGEFATLHDAQLAVAREHGLPSWTVLKETVTAGQAGPNHALAQVRWLVSRFRDADAAAWVRPADDEVREHFAGDFLALASPATVTGMLAKVAESLREDLVVIDEPSERSVRVQVGGLRLEALAEADPPHRLISAQVYRLSEHVTDDRLAPPPAVTVGRIPAEAMALARQSLAEFAPPGLSMAVTDATGADTGDAAGAGIQAWSLALGWADLDRPEPLGVGQRFMTGAITQVVTATVVLRLVADGRVELDAPADRYLRAVRLADPEVTVRELLSHTGGVADDPVSQNPFGAAVTSLASLAGPVMACAGPRGTVRHSNSGYAVLGQLVADVTGSRYEEVAESLVLRPLGLADSFFPAGWPEQHVVTGYRLDDGGRFRRAPAQICVISAMGGLWSTAADLSRFGATWTSLLPAGLAAEALRPQSASGSAPGPRFGLGWPLRPDGSVAGLVGGGVSGTVASLLIVPGAGRAAATMMSRLIPTVVEEINGRLLSLAPEG
jgi:CubicO group peptidase (beta-lactamase class C family)